MMLVTPLSGRESPPRRPAPDAVTRRLRLTSWQGPKKKRRWITNSAGVDLLELASVARQTLSTKSTTSPVRIHVRVHAMSTPGPGRTAHEPRRSRITLDPARVSRDSRSTWRKCHAIHGRPGASARLLRRLDSILRDLRAASTGATTSDSERIERRRGEIRGAGL